MNRDHKDVATSTLMIESPIMPIALLFLLVLAGSCRTPDYSGTEPVGEISPRRYVTPVHQVLTPIGIQVELSGMRPQALALSPDGRLLVTSGKTQELVMINPQTGEIRQNVALPSSEARSPDVVSSHILKSDKSGQLSYTGLIFSPDGSRITCPMSMATSRSSTSVGPGRSVVCFPSPCLLPMLRIVRRRSRPVWRFPGMDVDYTSC